MTLNWAALHLQGCVSRVNIRLILTCLTSVMTLNYYPLVQGDVLELELPPAAIVHNDGKLFTPFGIGDVWTAYLS